MRTREEILAAAASADAQSKASHLAVLEVLLDVRDELVTQGKPVETVALAPVHLEPSIAGTVTACDDKSGHDVALTWDVSKITCRACRLVLDLNASKLEAAEAKARLELYAKADHGLVRVGGLVGVDTSTVFSIDTVVQRVANASAGNERYESLRRTLLAYLGRPLTVDDAGLIDAVRELGSLAQDRKDEIDTLTKRIAVLQGIADS